MRRRRAEVIAELGGVCTKCGSVDRLEVDHVDPATKVSHKILGWSKERRAAELAKCQLLCFGCHKKKTATDAWRVRWAKKPRRHGTPTINRLGCRCDHCRACRRYGGLEGLPPAPLVDEAHPIITAAYSSGGYSKSKSRRVGRSSSADVGENRESSLASLDGGGHIAGGTVRIPVGDRFALVDEADAHLVSGITWHLSQRDSRLYARSSKRSGAKVTHPRMHHLILPPAPGMVIDHINGDGLDNRRANLRHVTSSGNGHNKGASPRNTSGFRGVSWMARRKMWRAYATVAGKRQHLGYFRDAEAAARAVDDHVRRELGGVASTNFPVGNERSARTPVTPHP